MRALTKLDISKNNLRAEGGRAVAEALKGNQMMTELNIASNDLGYKAGGYHVVDKSGVAAIANVIGDMGALTSLNMAKNDMKGAEAGKALGGALATNTVLKELDLSGQPSTSQRPVYPNMDVAFVKAFAPGLSDNGALTKFDISWNDIRAEGGKALAVGLKGNHVMTELNVAENWLGIKVDGSDDTSGIIAIADAIPDMGALLSLNLASNTIGGKIGEPGVHALASMLRGNTTLRELNVASNKFDSECAKILCPAISDNGAMLKLDVSMNNLCAAGAKVLAEALRGNQVMTEINISSNHLGKKSIYGDATDVSGVIMLADVIPSMGAISSVNLLKNGIPMEQAKVLANILKEHPTLKSLCGNNGNETELDMSGKEIGAIGAIILAPEIAGNGALTSLNLAKNDIGGYLDDNTYAFIATPEGIAALNLVVHTPLSYVLLLTSGPAAIADAIKDMRALSIFNISNNSLFAAGTEALAEGLEGNQIMTELNISANGIGKTGAIALASIIPGMAALKSLNLSQNGLLNEESGHALAAALIANSTVTALNVSKNVDLASGSSQDGDGFARSFACCLNTKKGLNVLDISNNNIPFTDDLFTSMCAITKVLAEGNNYSSITNPCLKVLCEKVLEVESIGKIDLHSKQLTGQLLTGF
jgi:Ran GTPase-activating protein (RanGAP) involved in mRNA processing and transport